MIQKDILIANDHTIAPLPLSGDADFNSDTSEKTYWMKPKSWKHVYSLVKTTTRTIGKKKKAAFKK